jgi:hypothetical protein
MRGTSYVVNIILSQREWDHDHDYHCLVLKVSALALEFLHKLREFRKIDDFPECAGGNTNIVK